MGPRTGILLLRSCKEDQVYSVLQYSSDTTTNWPIYGDEIYDDEMSFDVLDLLFIRNVDICYLSCLNFCISMKICLCQSLLGNKI